MTDSTPDPAGMPRHLPIGVDADGHGPTDDVHHRVCWCGDPECMWTRALAAERAEGGGL